MDPVQRYNDFVDDKYRLKATRDDLQSLLNSVRLLHGVSAPYINGFYASGSTEPMALRCDITNISNDLRNIRTSLEELIYTQREVLRALQKIIENNLIE